MINMEQNKMAGSRIWTGMILASLLWLCGCGVPVAPGDLIKPPLSEGSFPANEKLGADLRSLLPEGARLLVAANGEGRNGISYGDVDGDGRDEAVVVYEENALNEKKLKAALLKRQKEEWQVVWDTKGSGSGLDYAEVKDLNEDGYNEIFLGWSLGAGENGLDIYEWRNDSLMLRSRKGYSGPFDLAKFHETVGD